MVSIRHCLLLSGCSVLLGVLSACSTSSVSHAPVPGDVMLAQGSRFAAEQANDVTLYALGLVGVPYRYGGNTPESGFDCSGLIGHVYQTRAGIVPPRTVARLQTWGVAVSGEQVRSGDVVLFGRKSAPTHAGIYVGSGRFVHAPSSGGEVRLDNLAAKYWAAQSFTFRRP